MLELIFVLLVIIFLILSIQDFRHRQVSGYLVLILILLFGGFSFYMGSDYGSYLNLLFVNFILLLFVTFMVLFYFYVLRKYSIKEITRLIGKGDVLFIFTLLFIFSPENFILFNIISYIVSLLYFAAIRFSTNEKEIQIPLAGIMSVLLIPMVILSWYYHVDWFKNEYFYTLLY
ncbi:MAG: prepilin peptidase [Bacteroidales bacterium]|nr:prepilin peptidase [Bacteroidales bacterium]